MLKLLKEDLSAGGASSFLGVYSVPALFCSVDLPCHHVRGDANDTILNE